MTLAELACAAPEEAARASIYLLLSGLFLRPAQAPLGWVASASLDDIEEGPLASAWAHLAEAARRGPAELLSAHAALFVAAGTPAINPYASVYMDGAAMNTSLALLRRDLARLGLQRADDAPEPEDHLGALCESMAHLILRGVPSRRQADFLEAHIAPWAERCLDDVAAQPAAGPYAAVATFAIEFLASERQALAEEGVTA